MFAHSIGERLSLEESDHILCSASERQFCRPWNLESIMCSITRVVHSTFSTPRISAQLARCRVLMKYPWKFVQRHRFEVRFRDSKSSQSVSISSVPVLEKGLYSERAPEARTVRSRSCQIQKRLIVQVMDPFQISSIVSRGNRNHQSDRGIF